MDLPEAPSSAAPPARPAPVPVRRIGPPERLTATMALSLIGFALLILGVVFGREEAAPVVPTLDVILTQTSTPDPPKHADFIAQANNQGGGDHDFARRPREPQIGQVPKPEPGLAPKPLTAQAPPPAPDPAQRLLATVGASSFKAPLPDETPKTDPDRVLPTGRDLMQQSADIARQSAELAIRQQLFARRPRKKMITASTQEYEYAAYMRAWVEKVERVGNLNFPEQARRQGISGRLIMTVSIARDGRIKGVLIVSSSGRQILDEAAVKVAYLAAPYPPLPSTAENIDILEITRTWDFKNGNVESD
jgi:protein TonB